MNCKTMLAAMAMLAMPLMAEAKTVTMSHQTLMDKIRGGWAGQIIGCTYGGATEFRYCGKTIADDVKIEWNEGLAKHHYDNWPGLYDDIYMDLTFVQVFEDHGLDAPIQEFAKAFAHAGYHLWHANQSARYNILQGMEAPQCGHWKNNPHADDIDFQIEADYAGLMSPGMPGAALRYADEIGHIMCYGDGWYGGVYVSTMYALAFVQNDVKSIVTEALKAIPAESAFHQCMADVIAWHEQNPDNWQATWQLVQNKWGDSEMCPEGMNSPLNIDAKINSAYVIMGLLYGQTDYSRTIEIATRCGQDSDCNPATAAGILGTMLGYEAIPALWRDGLKEVADLDFAHTKISFNRACALSMKHALKVIALEGGKVKEDVVKIKVQPVTATRMEKSFDGLKVDKAIDLGGKAIDQLGEIAFEGSGVVLRGGIEAPEGYVGLVDVYIDGAKVRTMQLPASFHSRSNDVFWHFGLEEGRHTLRLVRTNCKDNVRSWCNTLVVFKADN